ncbi:MAG: hypothetical protein ACI4I9_05535 [Porcipelethomonas sp.]
MKKIFAVCLILLTACFTGCERDAETESLTAVSGNVTRETAAETSTENVTRETVAENDTEETTSETAEEKIPEKNFFYESDRCVKRYSDWTPRSVVARGRPVYVDGEDVYITVFHNNKLYRFDKDGNKTYVCDAAWDLFRQDGVMYCVDWGGATKDPTSLAVLEDGEKRIIAEHCFFHYGETAVFYESFDDGGLYSVSYDTNEISYIMDMPENYGLIAEYRGKLWFRGGDGLYSCDPDGSELNKVIDGSQTIFGFRNGYIYYQNYDKLERYSIETHEIASFNISASHIHTCNFTNDSCLIANSEGLFSYDADFNVEKKLSDNRNISNITVSDDVIIIGYWDKNGQEIYESIDLDGNVIRTFSTNQIQ